MFEISPIVVQMTETRYVTAFLSLHVHSPYSIFHDRYQRKTGNVMIKGILFSDGIW